MVTIQTLTRLILCHFPIRVCIATFKEYIATGGMDRLIPAG
jgi:hypothetical protein